MIRLLLHRVLSLLPTLLLVLTLVFLLIHLVPGDPVAALLGDHASPADTAALRTALGLDLSLGAQWLKFMHGLVQGDWGQSLVLSKPVLDLVAERLPATGFLALVAMLLALTLGGVVGCWGALGGTQRLRWLDNVLVMVVATPSFVLGPLLIVGIAVSLNLLPVSGNETWQSVILPALTLGLGLAAVIARMLATSLSEELPRDYVRVVAAKGGSWPRAWGLHALPNALLPVVQVVFLQLGMLLTGAVLTEAVFGWPGVGNLLVEALHQRDYPVIQGCILLISLVYMLCVLLADVVCAWLDPRVRP